VLAVDGLHTRRRNARAAARTGRGRRRRSAPGADATGRGSASRAERAVALLLGLVGLAGLALGAAALSALQLPLDLRDIVQQVDAFTATSALIGGGTATWLALVLALRTPISHGTPPGDRVP